VRYEPASRDPSAVNCQPGTVALGRAIRTTFPELETLAGAFGCFNRRRIAGSSVWSLHAEGRALDVGVFPGRVELGWLLACALVTRQRRLGVMRVIWDGHIWSTERAAGWGALSAGTNQHRDHIHVEQFWVAAVQPATAEARYERTLARARRMLSRRSDAGL
jgi:hypothetical protein